MNDVTRVPFGDFLLIGELHTGIDAHTLARMPRVVALGASALAAPFAGFGDFEAYPTLAEKAAIYASRVSSYQPLPDGNKRTAYDVMREFIDRNGHTFTHGDGGLLETAKMIEDVSCGLLPEADFSAWIAARIAQTP